MNQMLMIGDNHIIHLILIIIIINQRRKFQIINNNNYQYTDNYMNNIQQIIHD